MKTSPRDEVTLRSWSEDDFWLLERSLGDPEMTQHLGGPETPEQLRKRHRRYCTIAEPDKMFVIVSEGEAVGSVGYWEREWRGVSVLETGWNILPEYQKRGLASKGVAVAVEYALAERKYRFMHAFPATENTPSNALCRKAGFTLLGEVEFEYPPGNLMRCNDWRLELDKRTR